MKKVSLTIGLFTLVLVSTSFAAPKKLVASVVGQTEIVPKDKDIDGSQSTGGNHKVDYKGASIADINGSQSTGGNHKVD